jgi:hypothetical protein
MQEGQSKKRHNKWGEDAEKQSWREGKEVWLPWKTTCQFLTRSHTLRGLAVPLAGIYPREMKTHIHTKLVRECS